MKRSLYFSGVTAVMAFALVTSAGCEALRSAKLSPRGGSDGGTPEQPAAAAKTTPGGTDASDQRDRPTETDQRKLARYIDVEINGHPAEPYAELSDEDLQSLRMARPIVPRLQFRFEFVDERLKEDSRLLLGVVEDGNQAYAVMTGEVPLAPGERYDLSEPGHGLRIMDVRSNTDVDRIELEPNRDYVLGFAFSGRALTTTVNTHFSTK
jgi:hypothetical protein